MILLQKSKSIILQPLRRSSYKFGNGIDNHPGIFSSGYANRILLINETTPQVMLKCRGHERV